MKDVRTKRRTGNLQPAEYIGDTYDGLIDGDCDRGSLNEGCYRVEVLGESPSGCDLHVEREGDILRYNCFSASCPCRGSIRTGKGARHATGARGGRGSTNRASRQDARILEARRIFRGCVRHLPKLCVEYLERNNIPRAYAENAGVLWNEAKGSIVIPLCNTGTSEELLVREIRERPSEQGVQRGAKWLNYVGAGAIYSIVGVNSPTLVVVEAPTSAMAIHSELGVGAIATLGSNICDTKLDSIVEVAKEYEKVLFLPDSDISREKAREVKKMLTSKGIRCIVKRVKSKPRHCLEQLKEWINASS